MNSSSPTAPAPSAPFDFTEELVQTALGDWVFPSLNGLTFSKDRAHDVLGNYFADRLHQQDRLYVIVGSDSGNLVEFIRSRGPLPRGSRWVLIEPADILERLLARPELAAQLDEYVRLITLEDWPEHAQSLQLEAYYRIDGVVLERSLAALDGNHPAYDHISEQLDGDLTRERYVVTANLNLASFVRAQIANSVNFTTGIHVLKDAFPGKMAMVLAGGPSLDEFIPWITRHRSQLFLIAVTRISGRLQSASIEPDLLVTVDPFPANMMVSQHMFGFGPSTALVAGFHAFPGIVNRWPNAIFYTDNLLPWQDAELAPFESGDNLNAAGPTVTHTAVVLAHYLGFKTIVFAGLDLCHAPDGQTHASGSSEASAGPLLDFTALRVETNSGRTGYTTPDYFVGIQRMAEIAEILHPDSVRLINPSANAARIDGIEHCAIEQIPLTEEPFDRGTLDASIATTLNQDNQAFLDALDDALERMEDMIGKVGRLSQLALESNQAYFHSVNAERQKQHKRRIRAIDRMMRRQMAQAELLVKHMAARAMLKSDLPHDFFALSAEHAEYLLNSFYGAMQHQAQGVLPLLSDARYRIQTRRLEQDPGSNKTELAQRYVDGKEPERGYWLTRNRDATAEQTATADQAFEHWFQSLIDKFGALNRAPRQPKASLRLAEKHFSTRNLTALTALEQALDHHPDGATAKPYHAFAAGLVAELKEDSQQALNHYEYVLTHADQQNDLQLIEHSLLRVAAISLISDPPNVDQANQALETAALINPSHWAHIGQLALTLNQPQRAIESLSHYLQHFPGDSRRIAQLADVFAAEGLMEGVQACRELLPFCPDSLQPELAAHLDALQARA